VKSDISRHINTERTHHKLTLVREGVLQLNGADTRWTSGYWRDEENGKWMRRSLIFPILFLGAEPTAQFPPYQKAPDAG
jgi:hypothetical protein